MKHFSGGNGADLDAITGENGGTENDPANCRRLAAKYKKFSDNKH